MAKFNVELEHTEWQTVVNLLSGAAYRDVAQVINKIMQQLSVAQPPGNGEIRRDSASGTGT